MTTRTPTAGFSDAAQFIDETTQKGRRRLRKSNALSAATMLSDELATVAQECSQHNWDGFDALPVGQDTIRNAYLLLESLPLGCPAPSIGAEPDGDLTLEWHVAARRTLSVSVNCEGELHYAALLGPSKVHGTEAFFGEIPENILALIRRVQST